MVYTKKQFASELKKRLLQRLGINKREAYCCRICGLDQDFKPWGEDGETPSFELCGCCGVDFGYEDTSVKHAKQYREEWLRKGAIWISSEEKPANWSLEEQLKQIPSDYK